MHTAEIAAQVTAAAQELLQIGAVKAGQVLVVGCSTSEVIGDKIYFLRQLSLLFFKPL